MDKIIKTSQTICRVLNVLFWVVAALSAAALLAIVAMLLFAGNLPTIPGVTVFVGGLALQPDQEVSLPQLVPLLCAALGNVCLLAALSCYSIRVLLTVFRPMSLGKPFDATVSGAMKKLAYLVLLTGVVNLLGQAVTEWVSWHTLPGTGLVSHTYDVSFLVWFVVIRLFGYIFEYGEALQQLSDETL